MQTPHRPPVPENESVQTEMRPRGEPAQIQAQDPVAYPAHKLRPPTLKRRIYYRIVDEPDENEAV